MMQLEWNVHAFAYVDALSNTCQAVMQVFEFWGDGGWGSILRW